MSNSVQKETQFNKWFPWKASMVRVCRLGPVMTISLSLGPKAPSIWSVRIPDSSMILAVRL